MILYICFFSKYGVKVKQSGATNSRYMHLTLEMLSKVPIQQKFEFNV
jgi:hypothetical protein